MKKALEIYHLGGLFYLIQGKVELWYVTARRHWKLLQFAWFYMLQINVLSLL